MTHPIEHKLQDYTSPAFDIEKTHLTFDLSPEATLVTNCMQMRRLSLATSKLILDGEHLELVYVKINGLDIEDFDKTESQLVVTIPQATDVFDLEIQTRIAPQNNTRLEGLFRTSGNYCSQCEAEGFRTITYYLDRPDVLSLFTTKIIADKSENAVLLSNGNLVSSGDLENGKHFAIWEDPFKKPCYLFALVAGNLSCVEDTFVAKDNREIALKIYVEPKNLDKCDHAMASLKQSMKWDESRFGLIYDLDIYMIVAVDDFNMGAMENKGLNVFNSKFVLAKPDTATDVDYEGIEAVIGHEYFHNWTGNRVTCRDWFQLTLKEGLTVFRDQEFTGDMLSRSVKRIEDVKRLKAYQFPEDAGPMSHPIQPQSYIEMNNFYTMTVYEKGAEVVRLYHTLLGEAGFQRGMKRYFERHDGQAVTVEDFRAAMSDANEIDLSQMHHWYVQNGTPKVTVETDCQAGELRIDLTQSLEKAGENFKPLMIPVGFAFFSESGNAIEIIGDSMTERQLVRNEAGSFMLLTEKTQSFRFNVGIADPIVSVFRNFSAPVEVGYDIPSEHKLTLAQFETDAFVRWEAIQSFYVKEVESWIEEQSELSHSICHIFERLFNMAQSEDSDYSLVAHSMTLPDLPWLVDRFLPQDPASVNTALKAIKSALAHRFEAAFLAIYDQISIAPGYRYNASDIALRSLKNTCLGYLVITHPEKAVQQYQQQSNMTEVWGALTSLVNVGSPEGTSLLSAFYEQWQDDALVVDKWFSLQAANRHLESVDQIKTLLQHDAFILTNPNRVRSVLGVFGRANPVLLHSIDGSGYGLLAEYIIKMDKINPQVAARLVYPFTQWRKLDESRQTLMKARLEWMMNAHSLSKDVYEIASKSLA